MKISLLISTILFSVFTLTQSGISADLSWSTNAIAGSYFKYASVSNESSKPKVVYSFLDHQFRSDPNWEKIQVENDNFYFCYFLKSILNKDCRDIIALPLQHRTTKQFHFLTVDKCDEDQERKKTLQESTLYFMENLQIKYPGELKIRFLVLQSLPYIKPGNVLYTLFTNDFINFLNCSGHCQYAELLVQNENFNFTIVDSLWFKIKNHSTMLMHKKKVSSKVEFLNHQITNFYDCGRFSIIYLLYAISGIPPHTLSNVEIRLGFKNWIEGPNGFNAIQVHNVNNALGNPTALQQSTMSKVTGGWRKIVFGLLYAPRITEAAFVISSVIILYCGVSKLTSYGITTEL